MTCATALPLVPWRWARALPMIGKLLGHARVETTARYAHLARDSVDAAAAKVAASIGADILGNVYKNKTGTM